MGRSLRRALDRTPRQLVDRAGAKIRAVIGSSGRAAPPVFVLSTGRVGTMTLAALLSLPRSVLAVHEPAPHLYGLGKLAYQNEDGVVGDVVREAVQSCRVEAWRYASSLDRTYVETSPQLTFVARQLLALNPEARFIHMSRDPAAVIRSGLRRRWYSGHPNDEHRIVPRSGSETAERWPFMDTIEKNAWLWAETNRWIVQMRSDVGHGRWFHLRSEDVVRLDWSNLDRLYEFVGTATPRRRRVAGVIGRKLNRQLIGQAPSPDEWPLQVRRSARELTYEMATHLGHEPI